jgi:hypothetical protein
MNKPAAIYARVSSDCQK